MHGFRKKKKTIKRKHIDLVLKKTILPSDERLRRIGTAFISIATSRKARAKQMILVSILTAVKRTQQ